MCSPSFLGFRQTEYFSQNMLEYSIDQEGLEQFYGKPGYSGSEKALESTSQLSLEDIDAGNVPLEEQYEALSNLVLVDNHGRTSDSSGQFLGDFEDPLGLPRMVDHLVSRKLVSGKQDPELDKYLILLKQFQAQTYLTTVHRDLLVNDLMRSLKYLEQNIQSQTLELKAVIDANYLQFGHTKKAIDDVLEEFKNTKTASQLAKENSKVFNPLKSRARPGSGATVSADSERRPSTATTGRPGSLPKIISRLTLSSTISGAAGGSSAPNGVLDVLQLPQDLDELLTNLITTTSLMVKPLTEQRAKEQKLLQFIEFVEENRFFFDLPNKFLALLRTRNHEQFVDDYQAYLSKRSAVRHPIPYVLDRCFRSVDGIVSTYRKRVFKELLSMDHEAGGPRNSFRNANHAKFLSLVDKLHQLTTGNELNPIREFLMLQLDGLRKDIRYQFQQFERKFSSMQRKLLAISETSKTARPGGSNILFISLKHASVEKWGADEAVIGTFSSPDRLDTSQVTETWLVLSTFIGYIDEVFLKKVLKFVNNYSHYSLQGIDESGELRDTYNKYLVNVVSRLSKIFEDSTQSQPAGGVELIPAHYALFLPISANLLLSAYFLIDIQTKLQHILTRMGESVAAVGGNSANTIIKTLRSLIMVMSQRILEALCAVWINDCLQFYSLENWEVALEELEALAIPGVTTSTTKHTKLISEMATFQTYLINTISRLVYVSEYENDSSGVRIVQAHPSRRTLVSVEIQFIRSLSVLLEAISKKHAIEQNETEPNPLFRIWTLNNLSHYGSVTVPELISKFDRLFQKDLSSQQLKVYADIDAARLTFRAEVIDREKKQVGDIVSKHFSTTYKVQEIQVDAFVYKVLMLMVKHIHSIKPLSGTEILAEVILELNEFFLNRVLEEFRQVVRDENIHRLAINLNLSIHFYGEVFAMSKLLQFENRLYKIFNLIIKEVLEAGGDNIPENEFDFALSNALRDSHNEFSSFF